MSLLVQCATQYSLFFRISFLPLTHFFFCKIPLPLQTMALTFYNKEKIMADIVITSEEQAEELAKEARDLKDKGLEDSQRFKDIKNALLRQGYGHLVRKYDL